MKKIISLITKKDALLYLCSILCIFLQIGLEVMIPRKMGDITELLQQIGADASAAAQFSDIVRQGAAMLLFSLLALAAAVVTSWLVSTAGASLDRTLREKVFEKTISFSLEEIGRFGTSSLISRCTTDITQIQNFATSGLQLSVESAVTIVWVTVCISVSNRIWTFSTLAAVLIICVTLTAVMAVIMPCIRKLQSVNDSLVEISREHINGIRSVHACNAQDFQKKRFEAVNGEQIRLQLSYNKAMAVVNPAATAVLHLLSVVIYVSGAYLIFSAGEPEKLALFSGMVEFISYAGMLISAFISLIITMSTLPGTFVSAGRIAAVLNTDPRITDGPRTPSDAAAGERGTIEFSHVSFRYPDSKENVLTDISFRIGSGETVAVIGATGCGKTTLLNLVPRLYDATEGAVLVNGIDVKDYNIRGLRNLIGYVPQKSMLFSGTIAGNISYGDNGRFQATLHDIKNAAEVGQAAEFIAKKEGAYHAPVAHGGSNFSGGQRQRLTISRAVCRDPEIFLFDDSFSALDYRTDSLLRKALRERAGDATILIVAQRISTIRNADRIIVLDKGRIVGMGKHDRLLASCEVYREIALSQGEELMKQEETGHA